MVKVKDDLTGKIFERLTVLKQFDDYIYPSGGHIAQWLCKCSCEDNKIVVVRGDYLKNGHTKSCGCLSREKASNRLSCNNYGKKNKKHNKQDLSGEYGIIWATNTNEKIYFDLDDAEMILNYCWLVGVRGYPVTHIDNKMITMHVFLGCRGYDHIDRNKLNNRRSNLRPATAIENSQNRSIQSNNTSGVIGVSLNKKTNKWVAYIQINKKMKKLGTFDKKQDAIISRLKAECEYFKDFSPQKHLFQEYGLTIQN